ncbi:DNA-binding GntR family transcriptional regulator [Achromobacter insolitus]|jgi:DNA-binding GntR family transcriptional regulator|uniref:Fatty acid metabolism regulator protein n=3 Tax=Achromobacter insolitus TaxID=217204 RepID=A0A6S7F4X2_9BURK|nr:GntR family transcriptional regulator [Achromobacter insolitus]MCP1402994.1 DNA-binding GntR family transcriptional regulator [Achromobacter insolitus]CAB3929860.1 Fatty acid metabolism regulator protein [Achromobacter insolitus]CAB3935074.1 Fatty acid metabolism regulator protein [Achromobacter insolitus]
MSSVSSLMPDSGAASVAAETAPPTAARGAGNGRTLPATVAGQLRERIIQGEFPPGARLNERALCDLLGVSRTPLREAFRVLAAEGLVQIEPNRGAQVVALSEANIREAFEVIGGLEAMSCRLACERATDTEIAEIRALTYEMMASHARHDLPTYFRTNREIHERISLAAHNSLLKQLYDAQNARIQNLRFVSNENRQKWDLAMREHIEMAEALEARDADRLAGIMRQHLQRKCDAALKTLGIPPAAADSG